ncbi:hypothetical protein Patl1_19779 [Pistacia atlantica]|uniref:Uncharacterized protein n=1 Tax=Pistacia atlantica TaxID=434234 RepID=A0ACC1BIF2_9ROSI|nr:hypothetical protein Patl1_19779 [Pistacia atlantica]
MEAAKVIKTLADEERLFYDDSYLKSHKDKGQPSAKSDVKGCDSVPKTTKLRKRTKKGRSKHMNGTLNFGCHISKGKFSVLLTQETVSVKFLDSGNILFYLFYQSVNYRLHVSHESISQIELYCPRGQTSKFLVIQLLHGPQIYGKHGRWVREVDFTPSSCIGQSSALCLELQWGARVSDISRAFPSYKRRGELFVLEPGSTFSSNSDFAPIISPPQGFDMPFKILFKINSLVQHGCLPGPALNANFFRLVDPNRINMAYIEHALDKLSHLQKC